MAETARDYYCQSLVFPEYSTVQLLTLGNLTEQVRDLAGQVPRFVDTMGRLARQLGMYIVAGTIPKTEDSVDAVYNECFFFGPNGDFGSQENST